MIMWLTCKKHLSPKPITEHWVPGPKFRLYMSTGQVNWQLEEKRMRQLQECYTPFPKISSKRHLPHQLQSGMLEQFHWTNIEDGLPIHPYPWIWKMRCECERTSHTFLGKWFHMKWSFPEIITVQSSQQRSWRIGQRPKVPTHLGLLR